jgi:hypothetical protein
MHRDCRTTYGTGRPPSTGTEWTSRERFGYWDKRPGRRY